MAERSRVFRAGEAFASDQDMEAAEGQFRPFAVELSGPPPAPGPAPPPTAKDVFDSYKEVLQSDPMWEYLTTYAYAIGEASVERLFLEKPPQIGLSKDVLDSLLQLERRHAVRSVATSGLAAFERRLAHELALSDPAGDPNRLARAQMGEWEAMRWRGLKPHVEGSARSAVQALTRNFDHLKPHQNLDYYVDSADTEVRNAMALLAASYTRRINFYRGVSPQFDRNEYRTNVELSDRLSDPVWQRIADGGKYPWSVLGPRELRLPNLPAHAPVRSSAIPAGGGPPPPGGGGGGGAGPGVPVVPVMFAPYPSGAPPPSTSTAPTSPTSPAAPPGARSPTGV